MAQYSIRFIRQALTEAVEARRWYVERSPAAGEDFFAELDRLLALIAEAPSRWPSYEAGTRRLVMRKFPNAIVYRVMARAIQTVAVAHTRRRPKYWSEGR